MESRIETLSRYRFDMSIEALEDAKLMYQNGRFKNCLNRAYYAIFHAILAVNALDEYDSSKHSGVIAYFNMHYVNTGIFTKEMSKIIRYASENREKADYLDFFVASKSEARKQVERAELFCDIIREYLNQKNIL